MAERSFAEFLAALEQNAAEDDEDERSLLEAATAKAVLTKAAAATGAVVSAARTIIDRPAQSPAVSSRPKFCRQCGAQLKSDARFCTKCGTPVTDVTTQS